MIKIKKEVKSQIINKEESDNIRSWQYCSDTE